MIDPHFWNCHPEDDRDPREGPTNAPGPEECWHCEQTVELGVCQCDDCTQQGDIVPLYHCPICGRWWGYLNMVRLDVEMGK